MGRYTLVVFLALLVSVCLASYPKCDPSLSVGAICHIKAHNIKPTQFAYGRVASECKAEYLDSMSSSKLMDYLMKSKHVVPVINGWDGEFYAIDHHHLTRALLDSSVSKDDQVMYAQIVDDLSEQDELEFWSSMIQKGYTWLFDEKSTQPVSPMHLAEDMNGLQNDFYRSLAYFVRLNGGFGKTNISYAEFIWANWYRTQLPLPWPSHIPTTSIFVNTPKLGEAPSVVKWNVCDVFPYEAPCLKHEVAVLQNLLPKAMQLAASPLAIHLPGYGQGEVDDLHCDLNSLPSASTSTSLRKSAANSKKHTYRLKKKRHDTALP